MDIHNAPLLMTVGPVAMEDEILNLGKMPPHYPRTAEFSAIWKEINKGLQYVFQTGQPVFTLAASGTGAMQMAVDNLCEPGDHVLVPYGGGFGRRWADIAKARRAKVTEIPLPEGTNLDAATALDILERFPSAKAIFTTYNETSTTALADMEHISNMLKGRDMLWVVDAISALTVEPLPMDAWGCDVVITSSQKGLALPPGLAFIAFSPKAWKTVQNTACANFYFDAKEYYKDWIRDQSPFTPAVGLLVQLDFRLKLIREMTLDGRMDRYRTLTGQLRAGLQALDVQFLSAKMGNCTTAFTVPDGVDAFKVSDIMRLKHKIAIVPPYPGGNCLRIGNFGNISARDIARCCECLEASFSESKGR